MSHLRSTFRKTLCAAAAGFVLATASSVATAQQTFNWRMQSNLSAGEPGYESVRTMFVEALEEMSGGRLKISLHPVGALFPIAEGLEAVGHGIVEIGMMTGGYFSGKMGPIATLESGVPGAERDAIERYNFFYQKGFIDIAREAYGNHGVYYLAPHISPPWDIMSRRALRSKADFDGLKIRTFGIEAQWYEAMGASAVFLGGGEIYTALGTGVVDAVRWGSPSVHVKLGLHEVGRYFLRNSPLPAPNNHILVNQRAWNSLPDDLKSMMDKAARLASLDYIARGSMDDSAALAQMEAQGIELTEIPAEEWAEMEEIARGLWAKYADNDELSARAVKLLQEFLADLGR
jgi:TRAP-type mannitol/chloroaromatic compound transport system substrate-binding protein